MATAVKHKYGNVTMVLTQDESEVLAFILSMIGGSPNGPRGHAETVLIALEEAGVKIHKEDEDEDCPIKTLGNDSIYLDGDIDLGRNA